MKNDLAYNRFTLMGIFSFAIIFIYSATLYPGGSQYDINAAGYDWVHNYWCNLTDKIAMNGIMNPASPIARVGLILLCMSLSIFFFQFGRYFSTHEIRRKLITYCGIASMLSSAFIFTRLHDGMIIIASFLGLLAVLGIMTELFYSKLTFFKYSGVALFLLLIVNNIIYFTSYKLEWLPLIQKITFVLVLSWVVFLNLEIKKKINSD